VAYSSVAAERDFRYGFKFGNHATVPAFAATTDWLALATAGLPVDGTVLFNKNVRQRRPPRANGYRNLRYTDAVNDAKGVAPTCSMTIPATKNFLAAACYGIFQKVTEAATTPFVKDFIYPEPTTCPSFVGNEGAFLTLVREAPVTTSCDEGMTSAVPKSVTFSCYPDQNEGRLTLAIEYFARYHAENATYTGTLTYPTSFSYWNFADIKAATVATTPVTLYGFSFTMTNGAKQIPAEGYTATGIGCSDIVLPYFHTSGTVNLGWDASVRTLLTNEDSGTLSQLVIYWGADPAATDGDLVFKANMQPNSHSAVGSEESVRQIAFDCVEAAAVEAYEVHLADAIDWTW